MRKLGIVSVIFVLLVVTAAFGLALLRTYVFKPPPGSSDGTLSIQYRADSPHPLGDCAMNSKSV